MREKIEANLEYFKPKYILTESVSSIDCAKVQTLSVCDRFWIAFCTLRNVCALLIALTVPFFVIPYLSINNLLSLSLSFSLSLVCFDCFQETILLSFNTTNGKDGNSVFWNVIISLVPGIPVLPDLSINRRLLPRISP